MITAPMGESILRRAAAKGLVQIITTNPRDFTKDAHRTVDDTPYGGGPGMLMKVEPVAAAIDQVRKPGALVVMTDPTGERFSQRHAQEFSKHAQLIFLCGHYEGIDNRITEEYATYVLSIGDFVLTGGELAAMVMADATVRLLPGVLGSGESLGIDSHSEGLLSAPQYTRPELWRGRQVPQELLSGNHQAIKSWKRKQSLRLTRLHRPDLFARADLQPDDLRLLEE